MPRASGVHRTEIEQEQHREEAARLSAMGFSMLEISRRIGISHPTVAKDLEVVRARYRESQVSHRAELVREKLEILRAVRREALDAWERSKLDAVKRTTKKSPPLPSFNGSGKGGKLRGRKGSDPTAENLAAMFVTEMTEVVEGRLPASEYMNIILRTVEQERALQGLDEPVRSDINVTGAVAHVDISAVLREVDERRRALLPPIVREGKDGREGVNGSVSVNGEPR